MAEFLSWFGDNWKDVLTVIGSIVGVCIGVAAFHRHRGRDEKEDQNALSTAHDALWSNVRERPELSRVLLTDVDLKRKPLTIQEEVFLNEVFLHFERGWTAAKENKVLTMEAFTADVRGFFALPLPRAAWEKRKAFRNPKFVRFIEKTFKQLANGAGSK